MWKWFKKLFNKEQNNSGMKLENFVAESFIQICSGIRTAQNKLSRIPADQRDEKFFTSYINPVPAGGRKSEIHIVEFDIAVTASNSYSNTDNTGIKADIIVAGLGVNLSEEKVTNQTYSSITRIKFSVPIIYPSMPLPHPGTEQ